MRRALLAAALLVAALIAPGLASPAEAGVLSGACTTPSGVTVVVNFGSLGGGTSVRCYASATSSTTGLTALHGAGFTTEGTATDADAFVCRISGKPSKAQEPCLRTPPATAYWSYWHATNGGSWTYSSEGAKTRTVTVGGFEGWSFGDGSAPPTSGSPTRPPSEVPTVKLGPAASTTSSSKHSSSSSTSRTSTAKPTASKGSPTTTPTATATSTSTSPSATSTSGDQAGGTLPGDPPGGGGSPWPLVGAGLGIALVIGGAAVVALRRRGSGGF